MYRDQCSKTLYRTPLQPGWWLEGNQAMKSLKLLMFAALMVAMARALSLIPGIPIAHTKMTWGFLARALCALVCGPVMGLVFGFVEDILGFILQPTGDFFPGYTLSTMAGVLVYALCFYRARITVLRIVLANLVVNLLVNALMGSRGLLGVVPAQPGQEPGDRPAQDPGDICTVPGAAAHPPADGGHPQTAG